MVGQKGHHNLAGAGARRLGRGFLSCGVGVAFATPIICLCAFGLGRHKELHSEVSRHYKSENWSKKVTNVRKGGILIETVDQTDLDKLLMELDSNPEVKTNFEIGKPIQTNPQVICYGVSNETTEETVANSIKQHCSLEETSQDVKIIHNFRVSRGRNWIIETTPEIFKILSKTTKMNIGWERISYKDIRPKQCFKCCKFGHLAKHCKEEKDLRTNCGSSEHTWKNCKASPKCINCTHNNEKHKLNNETKHSFTSKANDTNYLGKNAGQDTIAVAVKWALYLIGLHLMCRRRYTKSWTSHWELTAALSVGDLNELTCLECVLKVRSNSEQEKGFYPSAFS
ncbi:uncharacterized protein CEXT_145071 [Caerostris extrusa]|uniref:CCHC-type domain-containing protein n=1 Tax=Caerostris extrusa TaxID=172846 RepID=A0AAV4PTE3_CAEEX|nr:uncharacterized protein CEXT_145071 [Caerostris extrusa]